jgi:hypothetical protein
MAQPTSKNAPTVSVRLADVPGPWSNPLAENPLFKPAFLRYTATVEESSEGKSVVLAMRLKRSTDFALPVLAPWHQDVPLDELALRASNLGSAEVSVSLRLVTADKKSVVTPAQQLAAGETRWLVWDTLDAEPAQVPGARATTGHVLLALQHVRAETDYRVAFHELECREVPALPAVSIEPVSLRTAPERAVQFSWQPAPGALPCGPVPVALTLQRSGNVFLRFQSSLVAVGGTVGLSPVQFKLPHGLPAGTYDVIADTRRVPVQGQPPRRAQVGTLEVECVPAPQPVKATVESYRGAPTVHVAGRPVTGLKYMTYRLDERYVEQFATTGVQVVGFGCACGEHPYGLAADTWLAPDRFDFSEVDARAVRVLSAHPQAFLLPRIYVAAPRWWVERYPDECVVALSSGGTRIDFEEPAGHRPGSWASERWRTDMGRALHRFIQHLRTAPYADRVLGVMICAGTTEEWMLPGSNTAEWTDYSPPAIEGFRQWLTTRYGSDEQLRAAWHDSQVALDNAAPPHIAEAMAAGTGEFVDPDKGQRLTDWWLYTSDLTADTIEHFAHVAKEASAGEWLCGTFYGYVVQFSEPRIVRCGHLAIDRLARSPHLDFFSSPTLYSHRSLAAGGYSTFMSLTDTFRLHGKLWWNENDLRTFRVLDVPVANVEQIDRRQTPRETRDLLWRELGNVLAHGCTQWYFDMGGGWYDDPDLLATVRRQAEVAELALHRERSSVSEVAVVVDPLAFTQQTVFSRVNSWLVLGQIAELGRMGTPFDLVSLADIEQLPPRKLWVFLNLFGPDEQQVERIHARLKRDGAVGLFIYGCGHLQGADGVKRLTGMTIVADEARRKADVRVLAASLGLSDDVEYGTGSRVGPSRFDGAEITPTFRVDDADAEVLGVDSQSQQPGLCKTRMDGWTSVYSAAPCVSAAVLRALATSAGVHVYIDEDAVVYANASLLSITVVEPGRRRILLPQPVNVVDAISGQRVAEQATSLECDFQERESRLFLLDDEF